MLGDALARGFDVLVLTNAMQPMQRPEIKRGLLDLNERFGAQADAARQPRPLHAARCTRPSAGAGTWDKALDGLDWLARNGFALAIAGRTCWGESEADARAGYAALFAARGWPIDAARSRAARAVSRDGRRRTTCRRSPRPAGASWARARAT